MQISYDNIAIYNPKYLTFCAIMPSGCSFSTSLNRENISLSQYGFSTYRNKIVKLAYIEELHVACCRRDDLWGHPQSSFPFQKGSGSYDEHTVVLFN
jgi:hypothetical protein